MTIVAGGVRRFSLAAPGVGSNLEGYCKFTFQGGAAFGDLRSSIEVLAPGVGTISALAGQ